MVQQKTTGLKLGVTTSAESGILTQTFVYQVKLKRVFGFYLHTLSLFLPPPQPPLNWTGWSRKEMRSFFMAADGTLLGDGTFSPGDEEGRRVRTHKK